MKGLVALGLASILAIGLVGPTVVEAGPGTGVCVKALHASVVAGSSEGTLGDAIADGFYGNEPNIIPFVSGSNEGPSETDPGTIGDAGGNSGHANNVVPSQSPGPKVTLPDGSVVDGSSVGDVNKAFGSAGQQCS